MSMEVRDTSRSKSAAEWQNIGKLYRVYMRQQRVAWFFCLVAGIMMIGSIFKIFLITVDTTTANDGIYVHGMSSGFTVAATFYIFVLCGTAVNILTNPVMSLYPGTVKTRFTARILYDCSVMFLITVIAILFHMGTMGVLRLLACTGKYVYSEILFDGKTFFMRAVLWLAYLYMLYFAFILFHTIGTKIGDRTLVIVCFLVFCGSIGLEIGISRCVWKNLPILYGSKSGFWYGLMPCACNTFYFDLPFLYGDVHGAQLA